MKKRILGLGLIFCLIISLITASPITVSAASGICGENVTWVLGDEGTLTISGSGAIDESAFRRNKEIKKLIIEYGVTGIGDRAFEECINLTSVTIADSVTSLGEMAFYFCESLESIVIPDSVTSIGKDAFYETSYYNTELNWENGVLYIGNHLIQVKKRKISGDFIVKVGTKTIPDNAFSGCEKLNSLTIPDGVVMSIGMSAFSWCDSLISVTIGSGVTSIDKEAFASCKSLTAISVSENNKKYASQDGILFDKNKTTLILCPQGEMGVYVIPGSVVSIEEFAFRCCTGLTSIIIPNSVTNIGRGAFNGCTGLTSINIPDNVTSIKDGTFSGCESLISISIPNDVTSIEEEAFCRCESLTSITIPENVMSIGMCAFSFCTRLTFISVSENNQYYSSIDGLLFDKNKATLIQAPGGKSIVHNIPDSVINIADAAFLGCEKLTSIIIPESVTSIGEDAFAECEFLTSIKIPDNVTSIKDGTFSYCERLTSITIPDSVKSIGDDAFWSCGKLESVTMGNNIVSIGYGAFMWCDSLKNVTMGNNIVSIGYGAFMWCDSLKNVTMGNNIVSIGGAAFYGCDNLKNVYFKGTEERWNRISFGDDNEDLLEADITFYNMPCKSVISEITDCYYDNNKVTVNVDLKYIDKDCKVYMGVYGAENKLIGLRLVTVSANDNRVTLSCPVDELPDGCYVKVLFWGSKDTINPVGDALPSEIE